MRVAMRSFIKYIAHLTCWYENPFVLREMYRAQRKGHGIWLALALEAVVLAVTLFLVALAGRSYLATRPGHTISYAWGGSVGALLILVMSLLHAVFVSAAVGGRAGDWISKEVAQGTLQTLLVTPMTPTEMVLKRAAWPFVNGVLVALMGLPFYVLCATMGSVSIWTLIGLYAIFAWLAAAASGPGTGRGGGLLLRGASVSVGLVFGFVAFLMFMRAAVRGSWGSFNPLGVVFAAARYVGAAQPFFGFHLPPLLPAVLLSPLWLSAAALSWSWRVYEDDRVLTRMGRARSALAMILALLVLGYLWPNLVGSGAGWAANLVGGVGTAVALRGTLLILLAIVVFVTAWEALSARYATLGTDVLWGCLPDPDRGVRQQLYLSAMGALSSVAPALVLYALGSLLAGLNPLRIGPDALGLSIGAALAGIFYAFGLGVTIWASLAGKRGAQSTVSSLLFVLFIALPIVAKLLPVSGEAKGWLTTFSPFGGLLSLTLSAQWAVQAPIWRVIGMQAALGTLFALGGIAIWEYRMTTYARRARAAAVGRPDLARSRARRWFMALWASVVQRVQDRWDNPVFVREVRVGSRGATWPTPAGRPRGHRAPRPDGRGGHLGHRARIERRGPPDAGAPPGDARVHPPDASEGPRPDIGCRCRRAHADGSADRRGFRPLPRPDRPQPVA
jgi:hypothetical protein